MTKENKKQKETKRERFIRIANIRVNKVLDSMRTLSNLANNTLYEYDDQDIALIMKEVDDSVREIKSKFSSTGKQKNIRFSFPAENNPNTIVSNAEPDVTPAVAALDDTVYSAATDAAA